jgi:two-component sensor histidine kinase
MSVVALLGLLLAAAILPALAFSGFLLQRTSQAQQDIVATLAEATAGAAAQTVDRQLQGMLTTARSLGTVQSLEPSSLEDFYLGATTALAGTSSFVAVIDSEYNQLINTRRPFGQPLEKASNVEPLRRAFETHKPQISDGFFGRTAQQWVFNAILPWERQDSEPLLLVITQNADTLAETLAMENLRGGWNAVIVDNAGIVLASTLMSSDIGKPFFLNASANGETPFQHDVAFSGRRYELITKVAPTSGWRVVIWAETEVVLRPMYRSFRLLLLGGLALAAVGGFAAWILGRQLTKSVRQLADDAQRLGSGKDVPARTFPVLELSGVSLALSEAAASRKASENEIRFLMREVAHRSKNQLAVVASLAKQSAPSAGTVEEFSETFQQRIQGLARSTDLLIAGSVGGVELAELLKVQVAPFQPTGFDSFNMEGPAFRLSSQAAQTLGLVFHELATNAAKYGAFSTPEGQLFIKWQREAETLNLVWRETLAGVKQPSDRRGFGTHLIDRTLGRALGAKIERDFRTDGLEIRFEIPVAALTQKPKSEV